MAFCLQLKLGQSHRLAQGSFTAACPRVSSTPQVSAEVWRFSSSTRSHPQLPVPPASQQYFKPHPPTGNKSYLEIFLTSLEQFWNISTSRHQAQHTATAATCLGRAATRMDTEVLSPDLSQHRTASSCTAQRGWHKGQTPPVPPTDAKASLSTHSSSTPTRSRCAWWKDRSCLLPVPTPAFLSFPLAVRARPIQAEITIPPFLGRAFPIQTNFT